MQVFCFEPVSIAECFAFCSETTSLLFFGDYVGLPPKPLLRFAAVLTMDSMLRGWLMQVFRFEPVSIAECFAFCSETTFLLFFWEGGGTLGCRPNLLGDIVPKPLLRFAAVLTNPKRARTGAKR